MTEILVKLRDLIGDGYRYTSESQEYLGGAKIFTLQQVNIDTTSLKVYKNGALYADSNYTYDSTTSKVTVTGTLATGDNLEFTYNAYEKYSDTELIAYIRSAFYYLSAEKYTTFTSKVGNVIFPTPTESEECLIAIVAAILVKGAVRQYKTPEFTITFEEGMSIDKKIKQAVKQFSKAYGHLDYIDTTEDLAELDEDEE